MEEPDISHPPSSRNERRPRAQFSSELPRIGVIGGGAAGITAVKELIVRGVDVIGLTSVPAVLMMVVKFFQRRHPLDATFAGQ